jgi:hypothetical protein
VPCSLDGTLDFFPLPPSRQLLIIFFLYRPTPLLDIGAQTSDEKSTVGQKERSSIGGTLLK